MKVICRSMTNSENFKEHGLQTYENPKFSDSHNYNIT